MSLFDPGWTPSAEIPEGYRYDETSRDFFRRVDALTEVTPIHPIWYKTHPEDRHKSLDELADEIEQSKYTNPIRLDSKSGTLRELAQIAARQRELADFVWPTNNITPRRVLLLLFGVYRLLIQLFRIPAILTLAFLIYNLTGQGYMIILTPILYMAMFYQLYILFFDDLVFGRAFLGKTTKVKAGTYAHPHDASAQRILKSPELNKIINETSTYPMGWFNGDWQTLLPVVVNDMVDFKIPYIRRYVRNSYDTTESIAVDVAFPSKEVVIDEASDDNNNNTTNATTNNNNTQQQPSQSKKTIQELYHDPSKPILVLLHGLNGSSQVSHVQAHVDYYRKRGHTCVAVNGRGYGGTFAIQSLFVASRTSDYEMGVKFAHVGAGNNTLDDIISYTRKNPHTTRTHEKQLLSFSSCWKGKITPMNLDNAPKAVRTPIIGTGFSLGGILVAVYCSRQGKMSGLTAAFCVSAFGQRLKMQNPQQSERDWDPLLMDTLKGFVTKSEPLLYRPQGGDMFRDQYKKTRFVDIKGVYNSTSIISFDDNFSKHVHGSDDVEFYSNHLSFAADGRLNNLRTKLMILHPENDPILNIDCLYPAAQSLMLEKDQDLSFKELRSSYYTSPVQNLFLHCPKFGGHVGSYRGWNDKWCYIAELSHAFNNASVDDVLMTQKQQQRLQQTTMNPKSTTLNNNTSSSRLSTSSMSSSTAQGLANAQRSSRYGSGNGSRGSQDSVRHRIQSRSYSPSSSNHFQLTCPSQSYHTNNNNTNNHNKDCNNSTIFTATTGLNSSQTGSSGVLKSGVTQQDSDSGTSHSSPSSSNATLTGSSGQYLSDGGDNGVHMRANPNRNNTIIAMMSSNNNNNNHNKNNNNNNILMLNSPPPQQPYLGHPRHPSNPQHQRHLIASPEHHSGLASSSSQSPQSLQSLQSPQQAQDYPSTFLNNNLIKPLHPTHIAHCSVSSDSDPQHDIIPRPPHQHNSTQSTNSFLHNADMYLPHQH